MSDKKDTKASRETLIINKVSEIISVAVKKLPNSSGDVLNFLADIIAGFVLVYLWKEGILPSEQVLLSFGIFLAFLLLCFTGSLLMRRVNIKKTTK